MSYSSSKQTHTETLTKLFYDPFHWQVKKTTIFITIVINHHCYHHYHQHPYLEPTNAETITKYLRKRIKIIIIIMVFVKILIMTNCNDDDGGPTQKQSRNYSAVYSDGEHKGCLTHSEMILAIIISRVILCSHFLSFLALHVLKLL